MANMFFSPRLICENMAKFVIKATGTKWKDQNIQLRPNTPLKLFKKVLIKDKQDPLLFFFVKSKFF